jgi:hypothetical protein
VCGDCDFEVPAFVWHELDRLHAELAFTSLVQGGSAGVDRYAREWAAARPRSNALSVGRSGTGTDPQPPQNETLGCWSGSQT